MSVVSGCSVGFSVCTLKQFMVLYTYEVEGAIYLIRVVKPYPLAAPPGSVSSVPTPSTRGNPTSSLPT